MQEHFHGFQCGIMESAEYGFLNMEAKDGTLNKKV